MTIIALHFLAAWSSVQSSLLLPFTSFFLSPLINSATVGGIFVPFLSCPSNQLYLHIYKLLCTPQYKWLSTPTPPIFCGCIHRDIYTHTHTVTHTHAHAHTHTHTHAHAHTHAHTLRTHTCIQSALTHIVVVKQTNRNGVLIIASLYKQMTVVYHCMCPCQWFMEDVAPSSLV